MAKLNTDKIKALFQETLSRNTAIDLLTVALGQSIENLSEEQAIDQIAIPLGFGGVLPEQRKGFLLNPKQEFLSKWNIPVSAYPDGIDFNEWETELEEIGSDYGKAGLLAMFWLNNSFGIEAHQFDDYYRGDCNDFDLFDHMDIPSFCRDALEDKEEDILRSYCEENSYIYTEQDRRYFFFSR